MNETIRHSAIVKGVEGQHVRVLIVQSSACSACAARQMCNSAESKVKEVTVLTPDADSYRVGQEVLLEGRVADGRMAAIIAYGLPLLLLLPTLVLSIHLTGSETLGALTSLLAVALYYLCVYLFFRHRLQARFSFRLVPS